jgi:hypothetical protein
VKRGKLMKRTNKRNVMKAVLVAMVAGLLLVPTSSGAATQMGANEDPRVTGDLELQTDGCRSQQEKYRGEVVAKGKTCLRIYTYDPTSEDDAERNYGVVWLQSNLNSSRGWCGSEVLSDVDLPNNVRVESREPRTMDVNRNAKPYETEVTADAGEQSTSEIEATVSQDQLLYKDKVTTKIQTGNVFRLKWKGLESAKLGFASGAEISWAEDDSPGAISFRLNYQLSRGRGC